MGKIKNRLQTAETSSVHKCMKMKNIHVSNRDEFHSCVLFVFVSSSNVY